MTLIENQNKFSRLLLKWNKEKNKRAMPWKGEKNPYKIWLSEIILQQTRVEQGLDYYNNFLKKFPDINKLSKAPDNKVFKMWEGLGYYTRCRNLIATARFIAKEKKGKFPDNYEEILSLKGIGPYTAAAISSFAFNLPHAVVDGNVYRVLARIFGIKKPVDSTQGKKHFNDLANELLDKNQPGLYNQAIMDFGAIICKPASPLCKECVFNKTCFAFLNNKIDELPVKEKRIVRRHRWFYYLILECNDEIYIRQRAGKDIWHHLHEFILFEEKKMIPKNSILKYLEKENSAYAKFEISDLFIQHLSHQQINAFFISQKIKQKPSDSEEGFWVKKNKLRQFAFPVVIRNFLNSRKINQLKY